MEREKIFTLSMILYGLAFALSAFFLYRTNDSNGTISARERLCRNKIAGVIIAFIALIWCAKHGIAIFPGEKISDYFVPCAIIFTVAAYFLLDFLPARALGALMILIAHYHLYWIFAMNPPLRQLASLAAFITGTCGIILSGKPCLLRDFFRKVSKEPAFRQISVAVLIVLAFVYIGYGAYHVINR